MEISKEEFILLRDFIFTNTGIFFEEKKLYFLRTRLANRIVETNCSNIKEYYRFLKYQRNDEELKKLINLVTVNETYFFRDLSQMNAFANEVLPVVVDSRRRDNAKRIKIWSAACASGEEAYTIAIILREHIKDLNDWEIEIIASDINTEVLRKCEEGVYSARAVKDVPKDILKKYFSNDGTSYIIDESIKRMVRLKRLNIINSDSVKQIRNVDILFCRNVLIYFNDKSKKQVINDFFDIINKGGYIFLGVGETLGRISASFKCVRLARAVVYQK